MDNMQALLKEHESLANRLLAWVFLYVMRKRHNQVRGDNNPPVQSNNAASSLPRRSRPSRSASRSLIIWTRSKP